MLYLGHTEMGRIDFDDLSGCIALVCIKNRCQPAILEPLEESGKKDNSTAGSESVLAVAINLADHLTRNELGDDIDTNGSEETPLLVWAVLHHLHAVVRVLLSKDLEAKKLYNKSERSPLVLAVRSEDEISTRLLAEHGVSFPGILLDAVQTGNTELVRILLATKADTIVYEDYDSPLKLATRNNHGACVRLLAEHGLPGNTALLTAVEMKSEVLVGILASNCATTPWALVAAVEDVSINIMRILLAHGADPNRVVKDSKGDYDSWYSEIHLTALHAAIRGQQTEIVQLLIANGADANAKGWILHSHSDYPGQGFMDNESMEWAISPLHLAVSNPSETIAEILIDNGAELDSLLLVGDDHDWQSRMYGSTPLHLAAKNGHRPLTTLLLDRGAGVNIVECGSLANGPTALFAAVDNGKEDIVQLLLSRGADPNITAEQKSLKGESPLHQAVRRGNINLVRMLIDSGANVNALQESSYGGYRPKQETPLHVAASAGYPAIIQLLLDNGAGINAVDVNARTALQKAREAGHSDVVQLLVDRGAE
jgi:ankyrin repeat protein